LAAILKFDSRGSILATGWSAGSNCEAKTSCDYNGELFFLTFDFEEQPDASERKKVLEWLRINWSLLIGNKNPEKS
jgi:hypothetical protein